MGEQKLAKKLARVAKHVQESTDSGVADIVDSLYEDVIRHAESTAECGHSTVKMYLAYPEKIKAPRTISSINRALIARLEADGFSCPIIFHNGSTYELRFQFEE